MFTCFHCPTCEFGSSAMITITSKLSLQVVDLIVAQLLNAPWWLTKNVVVKSWNMSHCNYYDQGKCADSALRSSGSKYKIAKCFRKGAKIRHKTAKRLDQNSKAEVCQRCGAVPSATNLIRYFTSRKTMVEPLCGIKGETTQDSFCTRAFGLQTWRTRIVL